MTPPDGPIRVAIVGSRTYPHLQLVRKFISDLTRERDKEIVIVSGGAKGVDSTAVDEAMFLGLKIAVWRPDWNKDGKTAGLRRNFQIVHDADAVVAFWDEESNGTAHSMRISRDRDKLWKVFGVDGQELVVDNLEFR